MKTFLKIIGIIFAVLYGCLIIWFLSIDAVGGLIMTGISALFILPFILLTRWLMKMCKGGSKIIYYE